MKKYISKIFIISALISCSTSCEQYLDVVPSELVTEDKIWTNINSANAALAQIYSKLPSGLTDGSVISELACATDEAVFHWYAGSSSDQYNMGAWTAGNNPFGNWSGRYQDIRKANIFLEKITSVPIPAEQSSKYAVLIPQYVAEARFLRAMFYFDLFRMYGAVPLITKSLDYTNPDEYAVARNSVDEVVNFIVSECNQIATQLPAHHPDAELGRANKGAALALAARTLLYAASPLFNGNSKYAGVKNPDGKALFPQAYDKEKWKLAADAAKKVLDLDYKLYTSTDPINSYEKLFYTRDWQETILPYNHPNTKMIEQNHLPYGGAFRGWSNYSPLEELVESYEMKNGKPISDPTSGYTETGFWTAPVVGGDGTAATVTLTNVSNRYKDRDPRFYATVSFQNSMWAAATTRIPIRLAWWGAGQANGSNGWPMQGGGTTSISGYTIRKWLDPSVDIGNWYTSPDARRNYPIFRLAEFYLAYAEALNEYNGGPNAEAVAAINKVRARVNMPGLPVVASDNTLEGFRSRVRNEKRVEFAFEAHRFWDVRRWLIAENVDRGAVHGMNSRPASGELVATGLNVNSQEAGLAVFYKKVPLQTRVFEYRHYLMPIPINEMDVNRQLVQNFGW
ncbi:RagB/SusD family nutrient uptake outer membrane protein [Dyadobacter psychrotolerans]|uniref:RagB/SusD family nutrient uptake outer membrane protein n=1 Tax=Dyadobacter psychrotolerans TaxID=2541721 RepID=A0A4R5DG88_9BACT|nr:RagB/SusD family nutrient uptake outer membrane protein [Dyadobacter psychrotolerans]TDE10824.1 RagB/SusD family nutrient uptake outer membrane protein [Dyadobacter psychrotolerans]